MGKVGCLEVRIVEIRDLPTAYCICSCELGEYATPSKKKNEANAQYDQTFYIPVNRAISVLTIMTWKKKFIGADRPCGYYAVNINSLPRAPNPKKEPEWHTLVGPPKNVIKAGLSGGDVISSSTETAAAAAAEQKSPRPTGEEVGKIRLQMYLHLPAAEKQAIKGITLQGEWKDGLNGGALVANPIWYQNPQFLLTLSAAKDITITLAQDTVEKPEPTTFYLLRYDDAFYKGRRKAVFYVDEAVKLAADGEFLSPVPGPRVEHTFSLTPGMYCIVPCSHIKASEDTSVPRYSAKFQVGAFCDNQQCINLTPLPTDPSLGWSELHTKGEWTQDNSGGSDVTGTSWSKNPQYLLAIKARTDVCITLNQQDASRCIGIYVIRVQDPKHKAVSYVDEVGATAKCSSMNSVGTTIQGLDEGNYVVIPVTYEAQQFGPFTLDVVTMDPAATLTPLTTEWQHKRTVKGQWRAESAGGSLNHETFINNPQYALTFSPKSPAERSFTVQLVQSKTKKSPTDLASIGIVVLTNIPDRRVQLGDLQKENLMTQSRAWSTLRAIGCNGMLPQELPEDGKVRAVVIPSTMNPACEFRFTLTVLSEAKISLESLDDDEDEEDG
jgi:hypothetical protein